MKVKTAPQKLFSKDKAFYGVIFCSALTLFFCLSYYQLSTQDMDVVELLTSARIRETWDALLINRAKWGHPPLYFSLAQLWVSIFDHNRIDLLSLSIIIGALGIPLSLALGRHLGLNRWAWLVAFVWAIHPTTLFFSRYARPQIGIAVLCCLNLLIVLKIVKRPTALKYTLLYILGLLGALWSHLLLFFWLGVLLASLFCQKIRQSRAHNWWVAMVSILFFHIITSSLCKLFIYTHNGSYDTLGWIENPSLTKALSVLMRFFGGMTLPLKKPNYFWILPIVTVTSILIVWSWSIFSKRKQDKHSPSSIEPADLWHFIISSTVISFAILLLITYTKQPLLIPRYLMFLSPTLTLVLVKCLTLIRRPLVSRTCAIFLIGLLLTSSWHMIHHRNFGLFKSIAQLEEKYLPEKDVVLALNLTSGEALNLYSKSLLNTFVVKLKKDGDNAWGIFKKKTTGKEQLWVLAYRWKGSIIETEEWKKLGLIEDYAATNQRVQLKRYKLPQ